MNTKLRRFEFAPGEKDLLRSQLLKRQEITPVLADRKEDREFASLVISLGIHQEIGTIHDEISKFLFDGTTGARIPLDRMRSELVDYRGYRGVRIWAEGVQSLDPRVQGMRELIHPKFSYDPEGRIHSLVFFPEVIARIAALNGAELVLVRPWANNTIFGGFDPEKPYYEANFWELVNVDALRYAGLLEKKQIAFLGTHDIVSHIAGITGTGMVELSARGREVRELLENYFGEAKRPRPYGLVLPYALGLLIDDLAQPMNYLHPGRALVVSLLMDAIRNRRIDPSEDRILMKYPRAYEKLIELARQAAHEEVLAHAPRLVDELIHGLRELSIPAA